MRWMSCLVVISRLKRWTGSFSSKAMCSAMLVVAEACGEGEDAAEMRRSVRAFLDRGFRHLWEISVPLVAESAAHGAVALKALEGLGKMHGIVGPEPGGDAAGAATLAEIGASVRLVSPLLADKIERVRALAVRAEESL